MSAARAREKWTKPFVPRERTVYGCYLTCVVVLPSAGREQSQRILRDTAYIHRLRQICGATLYALFSCPKEKPFFVTRITCATCSNFSPQIVKSRKAASISHIVFDGGSPSTLALLDDRCGAFGVTPAWVEECKTTRSRVNELVRIGEWGALYKVPALDPPAS